MDVSTSYQGYKVVGAFSLSHITTLGVVEITGSCPDYYVSRDWDKIMPILTGMFFPERSIAVLGEMVKEVFQHRPPQQYAYDLRNDQKFFGSTFGGIGLLLKTLRNAPDLAKPVRHENQVRHGTTDGEAYYKDFTSYRTSDTVVALFDKEFYSRRYVGYPNMSDGNGLPDHSTYGVVSGGTDPNWLTGISTLEDAWSNNPDDFVWNHVVVLGRFADITLTSFSYETDDYGSKVKYTHVIRRFHKGGVNWDEVHISTEIAITYTSHCFNTPSVAIGHLSPYFQVGHMAITDQLSQYEKNWSGTPSCGYYGWGGMRRRTVLPIYGIIAGQYTATELDSSDRDRVILKLRDVDDRMSTYAKYYAGSCYVSSSDAVSDFRNEVGKNYLESIAELHQVLSMVPNLKPFFRFVQLVPRAKLLSAAFSLVDFASQTYLLTKFGLMPFKDDILSLSAVYDSVLAKLRRDYTIPQILRGKSTFVLTDGPLENFVLTTRTKISVSLPSDSLILSTLPLSSGGLDPSFANLWDLVPFSFVLDWFFNLSKRFEAIDSSFYMMTANVDYCVHSYTLRSPLEGLIVDGEFDFNDVEYTYYDRAISKFYPGPRQEHYDWLAKTIDPPMLIAGSLLWTVFRP